MKKIIRKQKSSRRIPRRRSCVISAIAVTKRRKFSVEEIRQKLVIHFEIDQEIRRIVVGENEETRRRSGERTEEQWDDGARAHNGLQRLVWEKGHQRRRDGQ
ncbi:hypothetical protein U1Q18_046035 [Sarracenia purpurea var. burkii]